MSEVDNQDPMERIVHQAFHDLAGKHDIDVDKIAEIIDDYNEIMSKAVDSKPIIYAN